MGKILQEEGDGGYGGDGGGYSISRFPISLTPWKILL